MTAAANGAVNGRSLDFLTRELDGCTLTAIEAVRLASAWWDKTGRRLINKAFNHERGDVVVPSRILEAKPWDELDKRERTLVVQSWLAQYRVLYVRGGSRVVQ